MRNILATLQEVRPVAGKATAGLRRHDAPANGVPRRITLPAHGMSKALGSARA